MTCHIFTLIMLVFQSSTCIFAFYVTECQAFSPKSMYMDNSMCMKTSDVCMCVCVCFKPLWHVESLWPQKWQPGLVQGRCRHLLECRRSCNVRRMPQACTEDTGQVFIHYKLFILMSVTVFLTYTTLTQINTLHISLYNIRYHKSPH